jgi:2,4-dienoyl-CoA reductase-like NADH-dependent reductase (Old Yellow Enzyme family)
MNIGFDCIEAQGAHGYLKPELRDISRDWGFQ